MASIPMTRNFHLYRRLLGYVHPYRLHLLSAILCTAILAMSDAALPALMKPLMDGALIGKDERLIFWLPILLVALFLVKGLAGYLGKVGMQWVAARVIMDIRLAMFDTLLDVPACFHDRHEKGRLVSHFSYDAAQVKEACTHVLLILFRDGLAVFGLLAWMMYLNIWLTMICLICAPFMTIVIVVLRRRLYRMSHGVQDTMGTLHNVLNECLSGSRIIKLHGSKASESQRFKETANAHRRFSMKFVATAAASTPIIQAITAVALAMVIYLANYMAHTGTFSIGEFVSFFTAMFMLLSPLKRLVGIQEHIQRAVAACENVFSLIDSERENLHVGKTLNMVQGEIEFRKVCFSYTAQQDASTHENTCENTQGTIRETETDMQIRALSLHIRAGETIALVGPSGSGKSTLVNLLAGFYTPDNGAIYLDGIDLRQVNLLSLRRHLAYVGQDISMMGGTVRHNIAYGLEGSIADTRIWEALERVGAKTFVSAMPQGLDTSIGETGSLLSGGQRQRLAVARALIQEARILILDEASSALDVYAEQQILSTVQAVWQDRTCILITHRMSVAQATDRIAVLEAGHIVETGSCQELMREKGAYWRLHQMQFDTPQSQLPK